MLPPFGDLQRRLDAAQELPHPLTHGHEQFIPHALSCATLESLLRHAHRAGGDVHIAECLFKVSHYFPQVTRYSAIVTVMTLFEDQAQGVCEVLRKLKSIPIAWTELKGDLLSRFRTYVVKLAGLEPPEPREWERLVAMGPVGLQPDISAYFLTSGGTVRAAVRGGPGL